MDPNLYHLDWERTLEAIAGIIVLSFLVERVAALVFESRWFVLNTKVPEPDSVESKREKVGVDSAKALIASNGEDAGALQGLEPNSSIWPPDVSAAEMVKRAKAHLLQIRRRHMRRQTLTRLPIKELGAFLLSLAICLAFEFDALAIIMLSTETHVWGEIMTAAVVAGGSKASVKLFHDLLGIRSSVLQEMKKPEEDS